MKKTLYPWSLLIVANALLWCMLSFYQTGSAAPKGGKLPFSNAVEQRGEMVRQLKLINAQLKEQNSLLRSGKLQVRIAK